MPFTDLKPLKARMVLLVTIAASGLGFFASNSVSIIAPVIQKQLGASFTSLQWVLNSELLILSALIMITGALGDKFGAKKLLNIGMLVFALGALICGLSPNINMLILGRVVQGLGGAFVVPQCLAIINKNFAASIRGQAIGLWGSISGAVTIFGPVLTGIITDRLSWQASFLVVVPLALLVAWLSFHYLPQDKVRPELKSDWWGAFILALGLAVFSFGLIETSVLSLIAGLLVIVCFIFYERRVKAPLLDLKVLAGKKILGANIFTLFLYALIGALPVTISYFLQSYSGKSAAETGLMIMPLILAITIVPLLSGKWADKYGARSFMGAGALFVAAGALVLLFLQKDSLYFSDLFWALLLVGIGFGLFIPALTKTALEVDVAFSGMASGLNNAVARFAGLVGVSLIGISYALVFAPALNQSLANTPQIDQADRTAIVSQENKVLTINLPANMLPADATRAGALISSSFYDAFRVQVLLLISLGLLGAVTAFVTIPRTPDR